MRRKGQVGHLAVEENGADLVRPEGRQLEVDELDEEVEDVLGEDALDFTERPQAQPYLLVHVDALGLLQDGAEDSLLGGVPGVLVDVRDHRQEGELLGPVEFLERRHHVFRVGEGERLHAQAVGRSQDGDDVIGVAEMLQVVKGLGARRIAHAFEGVRAQDKPVEGDHQTTSFRATAWPDAAER